MTPSSPLLVVVLAFLVALPLPAVAQDKTGRVKVQTPWLEATSGYVKITGVDGSSTDAGHEKWIRAGSVRWEAAAAPSGRAAATGVVVITKPFDESSSSLIGRIGTGDPIPSMEFHAPAGMDASGQPKYTAFELKNVRIIRYSIDAAGSIPMESITFHFEKIDVKDGPVLKGTKILEN